MSSQNSPLYGARPARNLNRGKAISSSTTLAFTSQLGSLIDASSSTSRKPIASRAKAPKPDIFTTHNRNTAKRAKRDLEPDRAGTFTQTHSTHGEALDQSAWERSQHKMAEKARLYAAMRRGDVEDEDERYAVDFDRKWAEQEAEEPESSDDDSADGTAAAEQVEYVDEFGRTRMGSQREAMAAARESQRAARSSGDQDPRFTARPQAPANVIYGDTIQHEAFNPDALVAQQMDALAQKRDKSPTPPPDEHFDSRKEVRTKGTGFFQFSGDAEERRRQMENLEAERAETEKRRAEKESKTTQRRRELDARREEIQRRSAKRKAEEFLEELGAQMPAPADESHPGTDEGEVVKEVAPQDAMQRIEAAIRQEED